MPALPWATRTKPHPDAEVVVMASRWWEARRRLAETMQRQGVAA
jgi:hypothetical protein